MGEFNVFKIVSVLTLIPNSISVFLIRNVIISATKINSSADIGQPCLIPLPSVKLSDKKPLFIKQDLLSLYNV